jgi:hypothetical protein
LDTKDQVHAVWLAARQRVRPAPLKIYKVNDRDYTKGVCAVFNLRIEPKYIEVDGAPMLDYKETDGGLFVDLVPQKPGKVDGYANFDYSNRQTVVTCKFGFADVTSILAAIEAVRVRSVAVPKYLQSKQRPEPTAMSLFHKSTSAGTTGIMYSFQEESSSLRISKSATHARSVNLTLGEEIALRAYLEHTLMLFNEYGIK